MPAPALAMRPVAQRLFRDAHRGGPTRAVARQANPRNARILELQRTAGNRAVAQAIASVQRDDAQPDVISGADKAAPRRTTGFLGLNPGADKESAKLRKSTHEQVLESLNDPVAEARFKDDPAVMDFVFDELGISVGDFARWDKASDVLLNANKHMREQLAEIMRWFNKAENGDIILDRLVLSGHSNGVELWGESQVGRESQPGTMLIDRDLSGIAAVFPKAAAQVEDIMFSACFSISAVELVIKVFPNLKTAWSYSNFSPDVKQGSPEHVAAFTKATEGSGTLKRSDKLGSSALWTRGKGYVVGDPSLAAAGPLFTDAVRKFREIVQPMYSGTGSDLAQDQLMPAYLAAQQMIAHPGTSAEHRETGHNVMQIILRLRFWPVVRTRFGADYQGKLQPAYDALGMTQPDWKSMTRKAVKTHVDEVMKKLEATPDAKSFKPLLEQYLTNGIYLLKDKDVIRPDWI